MRYLIFPLIVFLVGCVGCGKSVKTDEGTNDVAIQSNNVCAQDSTREDLLGECELDSLDNQSTTISDISFRNGELIVFMSENDNELIDFWDELSEFKDQNVTFIWIGDDGRRFEKTIDRDFLARIFTPEYKPLNRYQLSGYLVTMADADSILTEVCLGIIDTDHFYCYNCVLDIKSQEFKVSLSHKYYDYYDESEDCDQSYPYDSQKDAQDESLSEEINKDVSELNEPNLGNISEFYLDLYSDEPIPTNNPDNNETVFWDWFSRYRVLSDSIDTENPSVLCLEKQYPIHDIYANRWDTIYNRRVILPRAIVRGADGSYVIQGHKIHSISDNIITVEIIMLNTESNENLKQKYSFDIRSWDVGLSDFAIKKEEEYRRNAANKQR